MADGPVIEEAGLQVRPWDDDRGSGANDPALGTSVRFGHHDYFNPLLQYGLESFFRDVEGSGRGD